MKKILLLLIILSFSISLMAQNFSYAKATQAEMDLKRYEKDTSANSLVLNEYGKAEIVVTKTNDIRLVYEYHVKIKIFNHKGFNDGTVELHLGNNEDNSLSESIDNISGMTSYKDDNGVTQVAELDPKAIYKTQDNKYNTTLKFAMPALRDGCVIEYRYIMLSPFLSHFHSWHFQGFMPKLYTSFEAHIPGYWAYNVSLRGSLKLDKSESKLEHDCFSVSSTSVGCVRLDDAMKDVPAFVEEEFMTTPRNFMSTLNFDLVEFTNPYTGVKTKVAKEWADVDAQLKEGPDFGVQLKKVDLVKGQIPAEILGIADTTEKIRAIYKWVQKSFKWNQAEGVFNGVGIKKALEVHNGSIGDINIILANALTAGGINAEAVLLSTRDNGIINKLYPNTSYFNYMIVKANAGNKIWFLDATDPLLPFGILPVKCLNDQGRAFSISKPSYWVNLDTRQRNESTLTIDLTPQPNGIAKAKFTRISSNYSAYQKRSEIKKFATTDEYADNFWSKFSKVKLVKATIENIDSLDVPVKEEYELEINFKNELAHDRFLFNPYIFNRLAINLFQLTERTYPVDRAMPATEKYVLTMHLPDAYTIDHGLQNHSLSLGDSDGVFTTHFENGDNTFTFSSVIQFNKAVYPIGEYPYLKQFIDKIIAAERAELAVRKK